MLDVFIGFMDEEVFYTLIGLLPKAGAQDPTYDAVYVIERGRIEATGRLFQRPLSAYPDHPISFHNPALPARRERDPLLKQLLENLNANFGESFAADRLEGHDTGATPKMVIGDPQFTVVAFGSLDARIHAKRPAVVIRAPEMGKEPSLFRPYIRAQIKSLNKLSVDNTISLYSIGAGGSTQVKDTPGATHVLATSVFSGASIERDEVFSILSFVTQDYEGSLYRKLFGLKSPETIKAAEADARAILAGVRQNDNGPASPLRLALERYLQMVPPELTESGRKASLCTGYFSGFDEKQAAESLGLRDVNMEDFHLLKIVNTLRAVTFGPRYSIEYPQIGSHAVIRIDCDPFEVAQGDVQQLNQWVKDRNNNTIKRSDLIEVIEFGLGGLPLDQVPEALTWTFPEKLRRTLNDKGDPAEFYHQRFLTYPSDLKVLKVLDPFRLEIASDLLIETAEGKAFKVRQDHPGDAAAIEVMASLAGIILAAQGGDLSTDTVKRLDGTDYADAAGRAVQALGDRATARRSLISSFIDMMAAYFGSSVDAIPVWIRQGKWKQNDGAPNAIVLGDLALAAAGADRGYYRASNLPGLRLVNDQVFAATIQQFIASKN